MNDLMLKVENVYKKYKLGSVGYGTLVADLQSLWAKILKKEDPNAKIGAKHTENEVFYALNGVNLEVKKGEAVGIIGRNGAGKSTLLKLLCQVTAPTDGEICLNGRIASMLEVGTGFNPELTGRENIYLNGAILGMKKAEIDKKIQDIISFSEVGQFIDTPVKRYSSGMYVKLAFAVAAHLDSEIVIMDEVLAVGDIAFQEKCIEKMRSLATDENRTILYVSHNMNTIRQLCDRCIVLDKGAKIFDGEVEEGINIYLGNREFSNTTNLEEVERPKSITGDAKMRKIEFSDKETTVYNENENLKIRLWWKCKNNIENAKVKFIFRNSSDNGVGVSLSSPIRAMAGENHQTDLQFDLKWLMQDKYYVSMAIVENNSNGKEIIHDHITRAFTFEIVNTENQGYNSRQVRNWGNVKFDEMVTQNIKI